MSEKIRSFNLNLAGKEIVVEVNRFQTQADGSVVVRMGDTVVMANATMGRRADLDRDYFPLNVDYEENFYAAGKIKGSRFVKRKGRPSDDAILISRLIDRSLRPLFPKGMRNPVQVVSTALSFDKENDADILSAIAGSVALAISGIPFDGPVGVVRIGLNGSNFIVNPLVSEQESSSLDLIVSTANNKVVMVEAGADEVTEDQMNNAIALGKKAGQEIADFISKIAKEINPKTLEVITAEEYSEELAKKIAEDFESEITEALKMNGFKAEIKKALDMVLEEKIYANLPEESDEKVKEEQKSEAEKAFNGAVKKILRKNVLNKDLRVGGRGIDDIRDLSAEVGALPRTHGSGYFQRGETRALTIATLGSPSEGIIIDGMKEEVTKGFIHYYSFPPYSVGETSPLRSPGRREIGHGALAEKALLPVIPSKEQFPYTILLQTEIISSSGSTSMGSTCGSTLALMDAGVPIKRPVAGIAMGLMTDPENTDNFKVLTDIRDMEDFGGDMDFKVTGTEEGITALQMDTKLHGLPDACISKTLQKAKDARMKILEVIQKAIIAPRKDLSQFAPRIEILKINPEKIGELIGPGGKNINGIIDKSGAKIDIEDDGSVFISSDEVKGVEMAVKLVKDCTRVIAAGEFYEGKVAKIMDFGAFVEIGAKSGLVHISEISTNRVDRVEDVLKIGDVVKVKVKNIDNMGRINLTMKV